MSYSSELRFFITGRKVEVTQEHVAVSPMRNAIRILQELWFGGPL